MKTKVLAFRTAAQPREYKAEDYLERKFWDNIAGDIDKLLTLYLTDEKFLDNVKAHEFAQGLLEFRTTQCAYQSTYYPDLKRAYAYAHQGQIEKMAEEFETEKARWFEQMCGPSESEFAQAAVHSAIESGEGILGQFITHWLYNDHMLEEMKTTQIKHSRQYVLDHALSNLKSVTQADGEYIRGRIEHLTQMTLPDKMSDKKHPHLIKKEHGDLLHFPVRKSKNLRNG